MAHTINKKSLNIYRVEFMIKSLLNSIKSCLKLKKWGIIAKATVRILIINLWAIWVFQIINYGFLFWLFLCINYIYLLYKSFLHCILLMKYLILSNCLHPTVKLWFLDHRWFERTFLVLAGTMKYCGISNNKNKHITSIHFQFYFQQMNLPLHRSLY